MNNLSVIWYNTNLLKREDFDSSYTIFMVDPFPTLIPRKRSGRPRKFKVEEIVKLSVGNPKLPPRPEPIDVPIFTRPHEQTLGKEKLQEMREEEAKAVDVAQEQKRQEELTNWRRRGRKQ